MLVVERGQQAGSKNVSGGLVYSQVIERVYPDFRTSAPLERAITSHRVVMLGDGRSVALEFADEGTAESPHNAYTVLRARFDPWMARQAEDAGAALITGATVDALLVEDGRVAGIRSGPDEFRADVVVIAEGTRSLLLKAAGLREDFSPHDVSLGVKEVVALPAAVIEERFLCSAGAGVACTLLGHTGGIEGGGFLYTNRDSLSLGVVLKLDSVYQRGRRPHEILDEFKSHPYISRLIEGGEVVEYSAQTVHRGGYGLPTRLHGDGYLVVGSAARLLLNNVATLRGMDFAVVSAATAVQAILQAREKDSFVASSLASYAVLLKRTPVYRDWRTFKDVYPLLDNPRIFETYPDLVCTVLQKLFSPGPEAGKKAVGIVREEMRGKVSTMTLARDLYRAARGVAL